MPERPLRPNGTDLEQSLSDLGRSLAFPPTPDLALAVRARLAAAPTPVSPWWIPTFRLNLGFGLGVAAAILLVIFAGTLVLSPTAGTAVADRLGLRGIAITHDPPPRFPQRPPCPTLLRAPQPWHVACGPDRRKSRPG